MPRPAAPLRVLSLTAVLGLTSLASFASLARTGALFFAAPLAAQARPRARQSAARPAPGPLFPVANPRVRVVAIPGSVPRPRPAAILLPRDYATSGRRYPVLYLLHGLGGAYDNWLSRTNLLEYTTGMPLIVVMPDAGDSWYANSVTNTTQKFQHYVAEDVVRYVDEHFRTLPFAQARYIAGLSMGGYGALMLATRYANRWSLAASLSGAMTMVQSSTIQSVDAAFGPPSSAARDSADLPALLQRVSPRGLPYYYLDSGTGDRLITGSRAVAAVLSQRGIPYEYHEVHGVHAWEYWNRRIPVVLRLVRERVRALGR